MAWRFLVAETLHRRCIILVTPIVHLRTVADLHTYYVLADETPVLVPNWNIGGIADELPARASGDPMVGQVVNINDTVRPDLGTVQERPLILFG